MNPRADARRGTFRAPSRWPQKKRLPRRLTKASRLKCRFRNSANQLFYLKPWRGPAGDPTVSDLGDLWTPFAADGVRVPSGEARLTLLLPREVHWMYSESPRYATLLARIRAEGATAPSGFPQVTEPLTEDDVFWMHEPRDESRAASKLRPRHAASIAGRRRYKHAMNLACFRLASDPDTPGSGVGYAGDPDPPSYRAYLDAPASDSSESDSASDSEESEVAVGVQEDEGDESDSEPDEVAAIS